jgi:hypothetical protein
VLSWLSIYVDTASEEYSLRDRDLTSTVLMLLESLTEFFQSQPRGDDDSNTREDRTLATSEA